MWEEGKACFTYNYSGVGFMICFHVTSELQPLSSGETKTWYRLQYSSSILLLSTLLLHTALESMYFNSKLLSLGNVAEGGCIDSCN